MWNNIPSCEHWFSGAEVDVVAGIVKAEKRYFGPTHTQKLC